jgi:hypothetical protein|tara:strand:+ start:98 stop:466 length:369 start_codon:yes stop_codon:yes gene_type:complete
MAAVSQQFMTDLKVNMTPDTVQIRTTSTVNNYGERTYSGSATSYDAYIIRVEESRRSADENLRDIDYIAYIPDGTIAADVDSQITLPAPISATRPIVRVNTKRDPLGQVAQVVYVGVKSKRG